MAKDRRRNEWIGFVAGILFGIFAILYYAIVGDKKKKCPNCGEMIPVGARACSHCGKVFTKKEE